MALGKVEIEDDSNDGTDDGFVHPHDIGFNVLKVEYPESCTIGIPHLRSMPLILEKIEAFIRETGSLAASEAFGPYLTDDVGEMRDQRTVDVGVVASKVAKELYLSYGKGQLSYEVFERLSDEIIHIAFLLDMSVTLWLEMKSDKVVKTFADGKKIFESMQGLEAVFNIFFFSDWMKKCQNFEERTDVYESALKVGVKINGVYFNQWFSSSRSFDELEMVENLFSDHGFSFEGSLFNNAFKSLINAISADDFSDDRWDDRWGAFLKRLDEENILKFFYKEIVNARSHGAAKKIYKFASENDIKLDGAFFNEWISSYAGIKKLKGIFEYMASMDVYTDDFTYRAVVDAVGLEKLSQVRNSLNSVVKASGGGKESGWWQDLAKCLEDALSQDGEA